MTKDELEKATGQELIDARDYCGVDGYYRDYLEDINAEMLKRFKYLTELKEKILYLEDNLRVARKDRERLQEDLAKGIEEFIKEKPATSLHLLANKELRKRIDKIDYIILLKIINCIKFHLCKQDEDYDEPIISPKFLSDILDQMAIDGFEWN